MYTYLIDIYDFILAPLYIFLILIFARNYQLNKVAKNPEYKYFTIGLFAKIIGAVSLCLIYLYYYKEGGDTLEYYRGTLCLLNLAEKNFSTFISIMLGNNSIENYSFFDSQTGFPCYYLEDNSFFVIRISTLFSILGVKSYIPTSILIATATYSGVWKLFGLLYKQFNEIKSQVAFAVLFIPSVFFWGSGILKDSFTLTSLCWFIVGFYSLLILKKKIFINIIILLVSSYIMLSIKPYIFYSSFAGSMIMYAHFILKRNKNALLKYTILPLIATAVIIGGTLLMFKIGSSTGQYSSLDKMLTKAADTQNDLKQSYYGGNSFDIGYFEPTIPGILSKAPVAMTAGLFRPFIWEAKNPVMVISALENLMLLLLFMYVIVLCLIAAFKIGIKYMLKTAFDNSLIIFSFAFSFTFAFSVGLTTANFGALVRYKIPLIPFFLASLFYIIYKFNQEDPDKILARKRKGNML